MKILEKEEILKSEAVIQGYCLIGGYSEQPTKNGKTYFNGVLHAKGELPFKVWQGTAFDEMKSTDYNNKVCKIYGKKNVWGGQTSIIIESIDQPVSEEELTKQGISANDFMVLKYNADKFMSSLCDTVKANVSDEAYEVFGQILRSLPLERFKTEYAAIHHHDNCVSGLLVHTWKVVKLVTMLKMYPALSNRVNTDALFVGAALHDIGKTVEYNNGTMSDLGKILDHNTIGAIILATGREFIISKMGEDSYNILLSILTQHHGEWGARPRTIEAYVVHKLDVLDAELTSLNESVEQAMDNQVSIGEYKLS